MLSNELTVISGIAGQVLLYYLIGINVLTFLLFGLDNKRARQGKWRIPEATLLILSALGGSPGALLGMAVFHHKTKHKKFAIGLPLILLAQIALAYILTT